MSICDHLCATMARWALLTALVPPDTQVEDGPADLAQPANLAHLRP